MIAENDTKSSAVDLEVEDNYSPIRDVILMILYTITALFAIVANFLVCKIIKNDKRMQTKTNLLIASMAVSDILAGIAIPGQWIFCSEYMLLYGKGSGPCGFFKTLQILTYFMSTLTMVTIAIHRYLGIFHRNQIHFHVKLAIAFTWIIGILFVLSTAVSIKIHKYFTSKEIITCGVIFEFTKPFDSKKVRKARVASVLLAQFLLPLILTALIYARIMYTVLKRQVVGESTEQRSKNLSDSKKRTILMLITVLVVFTICWLPVHTHHFVNFFFKPKTKTLKGYCNNSTSYFVMYWFSISSCCYNPIIYYIFDQRFQHGFKNIFMKFTIKPQTVAISTTQTQSGNPTSDTSETNL